MRPGGWKPIGGDLIELARRLLPVPRSLTGDGVRQTLDILKEWIPLELTEVPCGTAVYDWIVPPEWNVRAAWICDESGERLVDWNDSALHLLGYSIPISATMTGAELDTHLHSIPERPKAIPYRTSYFERDWGFCLAHELRVRIRPEARYLVEIQSTLDPNGSLVYGECLIPGSEPGSREEILLSTYICHPTLANDNVSGMVVAAAFARSLEPGQLRSDVRILFAPAGVGVLSWLKRNEDRLARIKAGLVVACVGDRGPLTYKQSRQGVASVDRAAQQVLADYEGASIRPFVPWGGDERQFCSPGFNLPMGVLNRTPNGMYPEYHTSDDNLELLDQGRLLDSLAALRHVVEVVDGNAVYERTEPRGEPQLSRHAIDGAMSASLLRGGDAERQALQWLLSMADGSNDLLSIAEHAGLPFFTVLQSARDLVAAEILSERNR